MRGQPKVLGVRRPQATKEGWALGVRTSTARPLECHHIIIMGLIYRLANTLRPQVRDLPDPD